MTDQRTTRQGPDMRYLLNEERGGTTRGYKDEESQEQEEPIVQSHKIERQIKYRRIRELSMGRDQPPCRPWADNGDEELWVRPGEKETEYHQKRVDKFYIKFPTNDYNACYTCMDHRKCDDYLCMARRLLLLQFRRGTTTCVR